MKFLTQIFKKAVNFSLIILQTNSVIVLHSSSAQKLKDVYKLTLKAIIEFRGGQSVTNLKAS